MVSQKLISNFVNIILDETADGTVVEINDSKLLQGGFASFEPLPPGEMKTHPEIKPNNKELHTALKNAGLHCAHTKDNKIIVFGSQCKESIENAVIEY